MLTDDSMPGFKSTSFQSPSSTRAKSRRSLTIRSIRRRPSRVRSMSCGRLSRRVIQVELFADRSIDLAQIGLGRPRRAARPGGRGRSGRSGRFRSRSSTATLLLTNASGLLISWATPATSWPRLASFSVCTMRLWAVLSASWACCSDWASSWSVTFCSLSCSSAHPLGHVPEDPLDPDRPCHRGRTAASS